MRGITFSLPLLLSFFLLQGPVRGQETLTNESIIKMVKAGLSEEIIIGMVNREAGKFSMGVDDLIALKSAGVSEKVLAAMIAKGAPSSPPPPSAAASSSPAATAGAPAVAFPEIGVYFKKSQEWVEVLPEVVNWKTGGTMKNLASVGVVKKDVNGHIPGPHSRNSVRSPLEFMIHAPEGVAITEYQLIRLRAKDDYREFRTVTGGVFNQKGGAMRDLVPFEGKKVGSRLFSVILPNTLGAGDYGFILMSATGSSGGLSSLSMGKMYTFRLLE